MKQFYLTLSAIVAALIFPFGAKALTVNEIVGTYNATDMNFSQNSYAFMAGSVKNLDAIYWDMTISIVEGNRVKLTNFIKKGINVGYPKEDGVFDIEGVFDPETSTITFDKTEYVYQFTGFPVTAYSTIAKYDGELGLNSDALEGEFESFTAKFDSKKNLTVDPWAIYNTSNKKAICIPTYTRYDVEKFGTRFTFTGSSALQDINVDENAPVEYYNLQGVKVENPENGIYIRRQGSKVSKAVIR